MFTPSHGDYARLDQLIRKLKNSSRGGEYDLLAEHLQAAHAYLLGAMPEECEHNLRLVLNAANKVSDPALREETKEAIATLSREITGARPSPSRVHAPAASTRGTPSLKDYFQGSDDVSFGIFYPKKHVVAVFARIELAELGRQALLAAGLRIWETIAVPGEEVEKLLTEMKENRTLWDDLMVEISRVLDTEIGLMDRYARWARAGAGFLLAYSATQEDAEEIAKTLAPLGPTTVHWFMASFIQHLSPTG